MVTDREEAVRWAAGAGLAYVYVWPVDSPGLYPLVEGLRPTFSGQLVAAMVQPAWPEESNRAHWLAETVEQTLAFARADGPSPVR